MRQQPDLARRQYKHVRFVLDLLERIPKKDGSEQIYLCRFLWLSYTEQDDRGMPFEHGFESEDELIVYHTGLDAVFDTEQ